MACYEGVFAQQVGRLRALGLGDVEEREERARMISVSVCTGSAWAAVWPLRPQTRPHK